MIVLFSIGIIISLIGTGFLMYVPLSIINTAQLTLIPAADLRNKSKRRVYPFHLRLPYLTHPSMQMFKPVRVVATLILFGAIAMTFMGAFLLNNAVLCLVMVIVEYLAYIWYSLSYIPYARTVSRLC